MGDSTHIYLPHSAQLRNIANAIGILAGLKPETQKIEGSDGFFFDVPGVSLKPTSSFGVVEIFFEAPAGQCLIDGRERHFVYFHFEGERGTGDIRKYDRVSLNPPSTGFWQALGRKLVDTFGGEVDYVDNDSIEFNYSRRPNRLNGACAGDAWDKHQRRIFDLKPLTKADLKAAK